MASDSSYFKTINSSALIEEIKQHPELYDPKISNGNPEMKRHGWEEVAEGLFDKQWVMFAAQEREAIVRELQVKWKSLRDNFTRVLRKEKEEEQLGGNQKQKKKYIYFDQLKFLTPYTSFRKKVDNVIYLDENRDNDSFQYASSAEENPLQTSSQDNSVQPLQFVQIQPRPSVQMSNISTTEEEDSPTATKRIATVLEEIVAMQKEDKSDDIMGNKKFLLSLLPFMKKLPDDVNLEVRLQLMSVLQTYTSGKSMFH
ncbi:uncharacterized protein LOC108907034 [Anoplophora glabripennis]|uniref:uncharacterized protein LOC108907034 n=2 Tax=Anoplophora glabripennis TaxID=217634 RepID=UPI000875301D|nr:uncharacterized protein LOC108907034 [Anoplophora glabripennis]